MAAGLGAWLRRVLHEAEVRVLGVEDVGVHGDIADIRVLDEFVRTLVTAHRSAAPQLAEPWAEVQPRYQRREVGISSSRAGRRRGTPRTPRARPPSAVAGAVHPGTARPGRCGLPHRGPWDRRTWPRTADSSAATARWRRRSPMGCPRADPRSGTGSLGSFVEPGSDPLHDRPCAKGDRARRRSGAGREPGPSRPAPRVSPPVPAPAGPRTRPRCRPASPAPCVADRGPDGVSRVRSPPSRGPAGPATPAARRRVDPCTRSSRTPRPAGWYALCHEAP